MKKRDLPAAVFVAIRLKTDGEPIQEADGLDLARAKTRWPFKWTKMPLGALLTHMTTHDRRHLWQAEQVRNDSYFPKG